MHAAEVVLDYGLQYLWTSSLRHILKLTYLMIHVDDRILYSTMLQMV